MFPQQQCLFCSKVCAVNLRTASAETLVSAKIHYRMRMCLKTCTGGSGGTSEITRWLHSAISMQMTLGYNPFSHSLSQKWQGTAGDRQKLNAVKYCLFLWIRYWQPGQPNSHEGNQDCGELVKVSLKAEGEWNDDGCFGKQVWICEKWDHNDLNWYLGLWAKARL